MRGQFSEYNVPSCTVNQTTQGHLRTMRGVGFKAENCLQLSGLFLWQLFGLPDWAVGWLEGMERETKLETVFFSCNYLDSLRGRCVLDG